MQTERSEPDQLHLIAANFDKDRGKNGWYWSILLAMIGRNPGIVFGAELGNGLESTRIRGVGIKVYRLARLVIGSVGVHRALGLAWTKVDGYDVLLLSLHGLHRNTVGVKAQAKFYRRLARFTARLNKLGILWALGGDGNYDPQDLAKLLGGKLAAHGDVMVIIISDGLVVRDSGSSRKGAQGGATTHAEVWAKVSVKPGLKRPKPKQLKRKLRKIRRGR